MTANSTVNGLRPTPTGRRPRSARTKSDVHAPPRSSVYLDYAATTPADPAVISLMAQFLGSDCTFGNPASHTHSYGKQASEAIQIAQAHVAELLNVEPREIIWTSGATESANLAIKGVAYGRADLGKHIIVSSMEHKAVLDSCASLERVGFKTTYVRPTSQGLISKKTIENAIRSDTILVSLMHVNNELGTITNIADISELTHKHNIILHIDAAQSAARLPLDFTKVKADLVSLSGHKMYGPKGIGALYIRGNLRRSIRPQIHGGGHQSGLRSGTLATHQIVGMGEAARLVRKYRQRDTNTIRALDRRLLTHLSQIPGAFLNGNRYQRVPGLLNVGFPSVKNASLLMSLNGNIAISTGSACTSSALERSHVLHALGVPADLADCSVRISFGRFTTRSEVDYAANSVLKCVQLLRKLSRNSPDLSSNLTDPMTPLLPLTSLPSSTLNREVSER